MKKFSRMPKSESGGLGGASGSGSSSGVSSYFGKVFAIGRYQVTVEELVAEGTYSSIALHYSAWCVTLCKKHRDILRDTPVIPCLERITHTVTAPSNSPSLVPFMGLHSELKAHFFPPEHVLISLEIIYRVIEIGHCSSRL